MKNYTVTGADAASHYNSILVIRATSPEKAKAKAEVKGIVVAKVIETPTVKPVAAAHDQAVDEPQQGQELHAPSLPASTHVEGRLARWIPRALFWVLVVLAIGALIAGVVGSRFPTP